MTHEAENRRRATQDDADLRQRYDAMRDRCNGQEIEINNLRNQLVHLHREYVACSTFRSADRDKIAHLEASIDKLVNGTDNGALILEINQWQDVHRQWTSWAGQTDQLRTSLINVLHTLLGQHRANGLTPPDDVVTFMFQLAKGAFDVIERPKKGPAEDGAEAGAYAVPAEPAA